MRYFLKEKLFSITYNYNNEILFTKNVDEIKFNFSEFLVENFDYLLR